MQYRKTRGAPFSWSAFLLSLGIGLLVWQCQSAPQKKTTEENPSETPAAPTAKSAAEESTVRLISLDGALTEVVYAAGMGDQLVAVDVTSTYPPERLAEVKKLGHVRQLQAEGVLALEPDRILVKEGTMDEQLHQQLEATGAEVMPIEHESNVEGAQKMIRTLAQTLGRPEKGQAIIQRMEDSLAQVEPLPAKPKVLFIYARGAGTLMVGGQGTAMDEMIQLAGARNAAAELEGFKPLTAEALVSAQPDILLFFDSGLKSLGGMEAIASQVNGMAQTPAYQNKAIISMEGQLLGGFGPRLGHAVLELQRKIKKHVSSASAQR